MTVYLYLGLLALIFSTFGFLLHAFYFGNPKTRELRRQHADVRSLLAEKQREVEDAQEEVAKTTSIVRSLEDRILQRNEEMEDLRGRLQSREMELAELRRTTQAGSGAAQQNPPTESDAVAASSAASSSEKESSSAPDIDSKSKHLENRSPENAPWQENLDKILNMLDKMDREIES